jgi:hypothetical protein
MKQKTYDATFLILGYCAIIAGHYQFIHKPQLQAIKDKYDGVMKEAIKIKNDYKSNNRL